jgi:hypothetical protein
MNASDYLTRAERLEAIRYGAAMELADRGITVGQFDGIVKRAAPTVPSISASDVLKTSLVFGVPAGLLWYVVDKSVKGGDRKTRRMRKELDYYNRVAHELRNRFQYDQERE